MAFRRSEAVEAEEPATPLAGGGGGGVWGGGAGAAAAPGAGTHLQHHLPQGSVTAQTPSRFGHDSGGAFRRYQLRCVRTQFKLRRHCGSRSSGAVQTLSKKTSFYTLDVSNSGQFSQCRLWRKQQQQATGVGTLSSRLLRPRGVRLPAPWRH